MFPEFRLKLNRLKLSRLDWSTGTERIALTLDRSAGMMLVDAFWATTRPRERGFAACLTPNMPLCFDVQPRGLVLVI